VGKGELWQDLNSSENTLFRPLPAGWTSIRLKIAAFRLSANYQQVGLLAYQDDDNYVNLNRAHVDQPMIEFFGETFGQVTVKAGAVGLSSTADLILRLDRDPATDRFTAFYSVDDGATWSGIPGEVVKTLPDPRLAIHVGANLTGAPIAADLAWVEIRAP
jgi:cytochrome c